MDGDEPRFVAAGRSSTQAWQPPSVRVAVNRDGGHLALARQKDTVAVRGQTRRRYDCRGNDDTPEGHRLS